MILYHAGAWSGRDVDSFTTTEVRPISTLIAYSESTSSHFKRWFEPTRPKGVRLFMDSGAFPVFMGTAKVDLDEYCRFLLRHQGEVEVYAALDVIGDSVASAANLKRMQAAGLDPLPTYHKGSPWDELHRLASEHSYIALGGLAADVDNPGQRTTMQDQQENARTFLDEVFHRLSKHWPIKTHAFGATAQPILERYPLYSADSSAAIRGAGFGRCLSFRQAKMTALGWAETRELYFDDRIMGTSGAARQARMQMNFREARKLERHVTDLWAQRGVRWDS